MQKRRPATDRVTPPRSAEPRTGTRRPNLAPTAVTPTAVILFKRHRPADHGRPVPPHHAHHFSAPSALSQYGKRPPPPSPEAISLPRNRRPRSNRPSPLPSPAEQSTALIAITREAIGRPHYRRPRSNRLHGRITSPYKAVDGDRRTGDQGGCRSAQIRDQLGATIGRIPTRVAGAPQAVIQRWPPLHTARRRSAPLIPTGWRSVWNLAKSRPD